MIILVEYPVIKINGVEHRGCRIGRNIFKCSQCKIDLISCKKLKLKKDKEISYEKGKSFVSLERD